MGDKISQSGSGSNDDKDDDDDDDDDNDNDDDDAGNLCSEEHGSIWGKASRGERQRLRGSPEEFSVRISSKIESKSSAIVTMIIMIMMIMMIK